MLVVTFVLVVSGEKKNSQKHLSRPFLLLSPLAGQKKIKHKTNSYFSVQNTQMLLGKFYEIMYFD